VPYAPRAGGGEPLWLSPERLSNGKWWLAGPFPYDDHQGFFRTHSLEGVDWKWIESPTYWVSLRDRPKGVYYARVSVYSPSARHADFLAAFADSLAVWWNGELKLNIHRHPKWLLMRDPWAERRTIQVRPGWNQVLLKIGPSLTVPTAFMFRIVDQAGATLRDLVYAPEEELPLTPAATDQEPEQPITLPTRTIPFTLQSWTDSTLAHYSGRAVYETQFDFQGTAKRLWLDLGEVGVAAEVWLNGEKAGERAWRPFRFEITRQIRSHNTLRIRVANSNAGWQSQGDTIYPQGSWGLRFKTERDRLQTLHPNGLEGPVRIIAELNH
jgi:hypothetical protein